MDSTEPWGKMAQGEKGCLIGSTKGTAVGARKARSRRRPASRPLWNPSKNTKALASPTVTHKTRTAGRSFGCPAPSASFLPLTSFERARAAKAWLKATGTCWRPGVPKKCPAALTLSVTMAYSRAFLSRPGTLQAGLRRN
ncbi:unnamed protein product [Ixodes pacificus]